MYGKFWIGNNYRYITTNFLCRFLTLFPKNVPMPVSTQCNMSLSAISNKRMVSLLFTRYSPPFVCDVQ